MEFLETHIDTSLSPEPLVSLYNKYQICVCVPTNVGGITNRFFEAALCGTTILHYELKNQPLSESILKPGKNCITYRRDNVADLKEKMDFLLDNPEFAKSLANQAHRDVKANHTIANRLEQLMRLVTRGIQQRSNLFSTTQVPA